VNGSNFGIIIVISLTTILVWIMQTHTQTELVVLEQECHSTSYLSNQMDIAMCMAERTSVQSLH
jgi:hypothetical protein